MTAQNKFKYGILALFVSAALTGCGLDGDDGATGAAGAQGPQGEAGQDGAAGAPGADGQDASLGLSMSIVARAALGASGAAEIVQYHAATQTIYATNGATNTIAVIDASGATSAVLADPINTVNLTASSVTLPADIGGVALGGLTSIAISGDLMAVAVPAADHATNGFVLFYNGLDASAPAFLDSVEVGNLPDMVTFTPDGGSTGG